MKPPKSIRNLVHTLLGTKKRTKSDVQSSTSLAIPSKSDLHSETLDKSSRHHRSADDLLDDESDFNTNRLPYVSSSGSKSLPRRSQSCLSVERPSIVQRRGDYGRRIVSGLNNENDFDSQNKNYEFDHSERRESQFETRNNSSSSEIPRSKSLHSVSRNDRSRRTQSHTTQNFTEFDEGYGDSLPRTTSWSHPQCDNRRTKSFEQQHAPRGVSEERRFRDDERIQTTGSRMDRSLSHRDRLASHEHLHQVQPRLKSSRNSGRTMSHTSPASEEKLRTCLNVLNRLSAQVKEIKEVSKRVHSVDKEINIASLHPGERERRLRELDIADAASRRLKSLLRSGNENMPQGRLNSRSSSGYDSSSTSRRSSSSTDSREMERTSRPPSRKSYDSRYPGFHSNAGHPQNPYSGSQPYPQSVSDMMTIWDAKEAASSKQPRGRLMTKEDSMSSGYATGSGSEDGRHDSLIATDADSVASMYSQQGHPSQIQYAPNHQGQQPQWQQPFCDQRYRGPEYDPYAIYGNYHQGGSYHQEMSADSAMGSAGENMYGTYGELFGYASSSLYDNEVYSNGWYQLPMSHNQHQYNAQMNHAAPYPGSTQQSSTVYNPQMWPQSQSTFSGQPTNMKHGGLSDIFFDPSAQPTPSVMDNVTEEMSKESQNEDESTWKSYGSFRYRNGQKMVLPTGTASRRRKTVRFSQTVRQRVETEESEMEDSTSVIKGGCDDEEIIPNERTANQETQDSNESSDIYMWPRNYQQGPPQTKQATEMQSNQNSLPEPIYEFPSGHIESSCMCGDCILARGSCQMQPAAVTAYY